MIRIPTWAGAVALFLVVAASVSSPGQRVFASPLGARGLHIQHTVLSEEPLGAGKLGLKLQLVIANHADHDLHDLRLFLMRAGPGTILADHAPARVALLKAGEETTVTWTFAGMTIPLHGTPLRSILFRVETAEPSGVASLTFTQASVGG